MSDTAAPAGAELSGLGDCPITVPDSKALDVRETVAPIVKPLDVSRS
jgi:hypothetical protein